MNIICAVCGKEFEAKKRRRTCSKECHDKLSASTRKGLARPYTPEGLERIRQTRNTSELHSEASDEKRRKNPRIGPYETNHPALVWTIRSPEGVEYTFRNLNNWCREHEELLPGTAVQAAAGIQAQLRKKGRIPSSWKGWVLLDRKRPDDKKTGDQE